MPLNNSLITVVTDGESEASLYMPLRGILEYIGYGVYWDGEHNTVNLISNPAQSTKDGKEESITDATETKAKKISVEIKAINAQSYTELGQYTLSPGDIYNLILVPKDMVWQ